MYTPFTLLTTLFTAVSFAAPQEHIPHRRASISDAFTTAGFNCWGRLQPGDNAQGQWAIHISGVNPTIWSPGQFTKQLSAKDVGPVRFHSSLAPNGDLAINFSASLSATASHVAQAFANANGKRDPGCHWYGSSATQDVNGAMDAAASAAG